MADSDSGLTPQPTPPAGTPNNETGAQRSINIESAEASPNPTIGEVVKPENPLGTEMPEPEQPETQPSGVAETPTPSGQISLQSEGAEGSPAQVDPQPATPNQSDAPQETPNPLQSSAPAPPQPPQPAKRSKTWLWLLLAVIVIIAGAAVAAHYVLKTGSQQSGTIKKDIPYLTYGLPDGDLTQIYPNTNTATALQLNTQLFEGLVRYDQQTKIIPALATDWSNPNTSTWIFNLRRGVKFHSGRPVTAKDVKFSLDYAIEHQKNVALSNLTFASTLKKVDVTGNYQVKITTDGPDPILLNRLSALFIMDSKAPVGDANSGTGPYMLKTGTKPSKTSIDLVAFKNYWGGHVYTRSVHIEVVSNASQLVKDVNKGLFDLAGSLDNDQLVKVKRHYQKIQREDIGTSFLGLNTLRADSPLASVQGRKAVAYALNVPAVLKAGNFRGTQASQLIPPALPGFDPSIKTTEYNPKKAKELLSQVKNASAPLTLSYVSDETDTAYFKEVAKELNAVGFNVKLSAASDLDTIISDGFGGNTDIFSLTDDSATLDGLAFFNDILEGNNIYHNAKVDSLVQKAATTIDPTSRIAVLQQISQIVAAEVPVIPMYTPVDVFTLTKPYYMQVDIPSAWAGVYFWQVYQK